MIKAIVFVSYHPQYLVDYVNLCKIDGGRSRHILILCRHAYLTQAIIDEYSSKFNFTILIPDVGYDKNLLSGFIAYFRLFKELRTGMAKALDGVDSFSVISCCSAWMTVNAVLSFLRRSSGFRALSTVCEHNAFRESNGWYRTLLVAVYTAVLRLMPVYCDKVNGYFYYSSPWDNAIRFAGPYEELPGAQPATAYIRRPGRPGQKERVGDIVIFYSDRNLDCYRSSLSSEERRQRVTAFMRRLAEVYEPQILVCSPHPLDKGVPVDEMRLVKYILSNQALLTQMYLQMNMRRVRACYAVSSTSLLYSSSIGIPSYSLYRYLGYENDANLKMFFENPAVKTNRHLLNISRLSEIGSIDSLEIEPARDKSAVNWAAVMYPEGQNILPRREPK